MMYKAVCAVLATAVFCLGYWWYALVWSVAPTGDSAGMARVHFLDVGQGDAILIETPGARQLLVDAGRGIRVLTALDAILSSHEKEIEVAVMTHPDADHIGGFVPVFDRYEVGTVIRSFVDTDTSVYMKVLEKIAEEGSVSHAVSRAYSFTLDGMEFDILWPIGEDVRETNAASIVLLVTYGDMKVLLTGDAPAAVEEYLVTAFPGRLADVDILKAGHHGSKTSTAPAFLAHTKPNAFVYSMKAGNHYGHPHESVLSTFADYTARFPAEKAKEYRTSDGTVSFCLTEVSFSEC